MPQSKEVHREYMRKRREGSQTKGSPPQGSQGMTQGMTQGVGKYHPIMYALVDKGKRAKLQSIVEHLEKKKLLGNVWYGCGQNSIDFNKVGQLLGATQ